jgi:hypothetical protein
MILRVKYIYLLLLLPVFWSCEEEIYFSDHNFKPRIVLSSIFTNDSIWVVNLTHSESIFDESLEKPVIEDAKIVITNRVGAQECQLFHTGNGVYKSFKCTSGQDQYYKISVYSPTYGSVTAESTIPAFADLSNIQVEQSKEFEDASEISFNITDNSADNNFYIWSVVEVDTSIHSAENPNNFKIDTRQWVSDVSKEIRTNTTGKLNTSLSASEFELENLADGPKLITSRFNGKDGVGGSPGNVKNKVWMIRMMTVSSDLYKYYQSLQDYVKVSQTQNSQVDPSKLFSNVRGGLGIFAGYSVKYYEIPK